MMMMMNTFDIKKHSQDNPSTGLQVTYNIQHADTAMVKFYKLYNNNRKNGYTCSRTDTYNYGEHAALLRSE